MSHFGTKLGRMMLEKNINGADLARAAGLTEADISRYRSGAVSAPVEKVGLIAAAISSNTLDHAELLRARLMDERIGPGSNKIDIRIVGRDANKHLSEPLHLAPLPPVLENALKTLRENLTHDTDLQEIVISLSNLYSRNTAAVSLNEINSAPYSTSGIRDEPETMEPIGPSEAAKLVRTAESSVEQRKSAHGIGYRKSARPNRPKK